jgi:hypothetical protein
MPRSGEDGLINMNDKSLLEILPERAGGVLMNWREIREKIHSEFAKANEEQRDALLALFTATMNIAEKAIAPEDLEKFREARRQDYASFLVQECLVGGNVCTETMDAVTRREVAADRMTPDDKLRNIAESAMAAPHHTRAQLLEIEAKRQAGASASPVTGWRRVAKWMTRS